MEKKDFVVGIDFPVCFNVNHQYYSIKNNVCSVQVQTSDWHGVE